MAVLDTDDFVRANNADLGTKWTPTSGSWKVASNSGQPSSLGSDQEERNTNLTWAADQWSEATLAGVASDGGGIGCGVTLRANSAGDARYRLVGNGSGYEFGVFNPGYTVLSSGSGTTFASGDRIYAEINGTAWALKKNTSNGSGGTTIASGTNSAIASGNPGLGYSSTASGTPSVTPWNGGDFSGGGGPLPPFPPPQQTVWRM